MVTTGTIVEKLLHNGNNVKEESHPKHVSNPYLLSTLSKVCALDTILEYGKNS